MNPPQAYKCSPSWTLFSPPSPYHPSGSSQCTSPKHPVLCIKPGLATQFIHDILHVSMPFSQIISHSPSPTESKRLFYTSVSLLLSHIQGYCYHLSQTSFKILIHLMKMTAQPEKDFKRSTIQDPERWIKNKNYETQYIEKIFIHSTFNNECYLCQSLF